MKKQIQIVQDLEPLFRWKAIRNCLQEVITILLRTRSNTGGDHTRVIIRTREQDGHVIVSVIDHGPESRPDELPRIYEQVLRGKNPRKKDTRGSGLALPAKYFVELHRASFPLLAKWYKGQWLLFNCPSPK